MTYYEKADWSRAFNQYTIVFEVDMINAIPDAYTPFIFSRSASA